MQLSAQLSTARQGSAQLDSVRQYGSIQLSAAWSSSVWLGTAQYESDERNHRPDALLARAKPLFTDLLRRTLDPMDVWTAPAAGPLPATNDVSVMLWDLRRARAIRTQIRCLTGISHMVGSDSCALPSLRSHQPGERRVPTRIE